MCQLTRSSKHVFWSFVWTEVVNMSAVPTLYLYDHLYIQIFLTFVMIWLVYAPLIMQQTHNDLFPWSMNCPFRIEESSTHNDINVLLWFILWEVSEVAKGMNAALQRGPQEAWLRGVHRGFFGACGVSTPDKHSLLISISFLSVGYNVMRVSETLPLSSFVVGWRSSVTNAPSGWPPAGPTV